MTKSFRARRALLAAAGAAGLSLGSAGAARAALVTFNFGALAPQGGSGACSGGNCVLGRNSASFATGGVSLTVDSFVSSPGGITASGSSVSQRLLTSNSAGESGLGVASGSDSIASGDSLEISSNEYLLLDNSAALNLGYTLASLSLGSIQSGEGGQIEVYGANSLGATLDPAKLSRIATLDSPPAGSVVQSFLFPPGMGADRYLVITTDNPSNPAGNVLLQQVSFQSAPAKVPEPGSLAVLGTALLCFLGLRRRRAV
ncbi:MAG: PEP-CTERM sorting domain-containing protein [Acetobacteraceae bacterium]